MNFLEAYSFDRLRGLARHLEAARTRLVRARIDPDKDRAKAAQVEPFTWALERLERETRIAVFGRSAGGAGGAGGEAEEGRDAPLAARGSGLRGPGRLGPAAKAPASPEKRAAVEELRWMVEEFKISLFAPEIKTAFPISAVRLAKKIKEIEGMIP
jgi:ATP-dependent helicase HrpA